MRRCTVPDCRTTLSEYNRDPEGRCWSHQERKKVVNTNPGVRIVAPEREAYDPRKGKA